MVFHMLDRNIPTTSGMSCPVDDTPLTTGLHRQGQAI